MVGSEWLLEKNIGGPGENIKWEERKMEKIASKTGKNASFLGYKTLNFGANMFSVPVTF